MKIVKLEDFHADGGWRTWDYLKITTDEGLVGWAEYAEGFGAGGVTALLHRFAPIVAGLDPRQVGRITSMLQSITRLAAGGLNNQAIAAIENACLDIKAKALGVPVAAHYTALEQKTPFLTVIMDNQRWNEVGAATKHLYPKGAATTSVQGP